MEHPLAVKATQEVSASAIDLTTSDFKPLIITSLIEDGLWNLGDQNSLSHSDGDVTKPKQQQGGPLQFEFASIIKQVPSQYKLPDSVKGLAIDAELKSRLPDFDRDTVSVSSNEAKQFKYDELKDEKFNLGSHIIISDDEEEVSVMSPVAFGPRCPGCGQTDHGYESCPGRKCEHCNALDEHWTRHCPDAPQAPNSTSGGAERVAGEQVPISTTSFGTCDYCEQPGHRELWCPLAMNDTPYCKDCHSAGHSSEECTGHAIVSSTASARRPAALQKDHHTISEQRQPYDAMTINQTGRQLVFCYCCAATGHYGDDCPKNHRRRGPKGIFSNDYARACLQGLTRPRN